MISTRSRHKFIRPASQREAIRRSDWQQKDVRRHHKRQEQPQTSQDRDSQEDGRRHKKQQRHDKDDDDKQDAHGSRGQRKENKGREAEKHDGRHAAQAGKGGSNEHERQQKGNAAKQSGSGGDGGKPEQPPSSSSTTSDLTTAENTTSPASSEAAAVATAGSPATSPDLSPSALPAAIDGGEPASSPTSSSPSNNSNREATTYGLTLGLVLPLFLIALAVLLRRWRRQKREQLPRDRSQTPIYISASQRNEMASVRRQTMFPPEFGRHARRLSTSSSIESHSVASMSQLSHIHHVVLSSVRSHLTEKGKSVQSHPPSASLSKRHSRSHSVMQTASGRLLRSVSAVKGDLPTYRHHISTSLSSIGSRYLSGSVVSHLGTSLSSAPTPIDVSILTRSEIRRSIIPSVEDVHQRARADDGNDHVQPLGVPSIPPRLSIGNATRCSSGLSPGLVDSFDADKLLSSYIENRLSEATVSAIPQRRRRTSFELPPLTGVEGGMTTQQREMIDHHTSGREDGRGSIITTGTLSIYSHDSSILVDESILSHAAGPRRELRRGSAYDPNYVPGNWF